MFTRGEYSAGLFDRRSVLCLQEESIVQALLTGEVCCVYKRRV